MTFFLCGFKYFHGSLPDSPKQRLPQARTGKVSCLKKPTVSSAGFVRHEEIFIPYIFMYYTALNLIEQLPFFC